MFCLPPSGTIQSTWKNSLLTCFCCLSKHNSHLLIIVLSLPFIVSHFSNIGFDYVDLFPAFGDSSAVECTEECGPKVQSFDLNFPSLGDPDGDSPIDKTIEESQCGGVKFCKKRKRSETDWGSGRVYQEMENTKGGLVKACGAVLRVRANSHIRGNPNVTCKVETFGKIIGSLDAKRRKWVTEMGFGGMLHLVDLRLPRALCYWLMTRIDPVNEMLRVGDMEYRLSCVQVHWILGLPRGPRPVPVVFESSDGRRKVKEVEEKYGLVRQYFLGSTSENVSRKEFALSAAIVDKLMSPFDDDEVDEFKVLFFMAALDMVLCPTQSSRFPKELLPALSCANATREYNWCALVLQRLMASVKRFARRFYAEGFAAGCGGCTLFVALIGEFVLGSRSGMIIKLGWLALMTDYVWMGTLDLLGSWMWRMVRSILVDVDFSSDDESSCWLQKP